jgi:hypothetical protein
VSDVSKRARERALDEARKAAAVSDAKKKSLAKAKQQASRVGVLKGGGGDPLGLGTLFGVPVTFVLAGAAAVGLIGFAIWRRRSP